MNKQKVIVIGAGYGGLALANLMAKKGYEVHVYEKNKTAGGRVGVIEQDGYSFDLGPSWYLMPEIFEQYYGLFGLNPKNSLDLIRFSPGYKVFFENNPSLTIHGDVSRDKETFESIEKGAGGLLERYVSESTYTYKIATRYFLYNTFKRIRDVLYLPILKGIPRMLYLVSRPLDKHVSSYFKDLRLKQLLEYHMVFLGTSPFQAPAIYSLMSHLDFKSGVFYPKKGMRSLIKDMQNIGSSLGVKYHFGNEIVQIIVENGKSTGIELSDGSRISCDILISNADLHHTETVLLPKKYQTFPEKYWQKRQPGPGALLICLGVRGSLPQLKHHNLYFVDSWRENFKAIYEDMEIPNNASLYICNPTKTDSSLAPRGNENLVILMPIPSGVDLDEKTKQTLVNNIISKIGKLIDDPNFNERVVSCYTFGPEEFTKTYNAWQHNAFGGESHILRQSIIFRTPNKSRKVKNLYFVGAGTLPGIGLPMCLIGAQLTYKRIHNIKDSTPLSYDHF